MDKSNELLRLLAQHGLKNIKSLNDERVFQLIAELEKTQNQSKQPVQSQYEDEFEEEMEPVKAKKETALSRFNKRVREEGLKFDTREERYEALRVFCANEKDKKKLKSPIKSASDPDDNKKKSLKAILQHMKLTN